MCHMPHPSHSSQFYLPMHISLQTLLKS
jgi:hypothetical protein